MFRRQSSAQTRNGPTFRRAFRLADTPSSQSSVRRPDSIVLVLPALAQREALEVLQQVAEGGMRRFWGGVCLGALFAVVIAAVVGSEWLRRPPADAVSEARPPAAPVEGSSEERGERISLALERVRDSMPTEAAAVFAGSSDAMTVERVAAQDRVAATLQAELGPVDYDWLLFRNGIPNRVVVVEVRGLRDAGPSATTDLKAGDILVEYAGAPVFTVRDLYRARSRRPADEPLNARILRSGQLLDVKLPSRPLHVFGIQLGAERIRPTTPEPARARKVELSLGR